MAQVNKNMAETPYATRLSLKPRLHPLVSEFLKNEDMIFDLTDRFGSPLNIIFPQLIEENICSFEDVYKKHHLHGKIYFTTKPNKSLSLIKQASIQNVGVDVSSENALRIALENGFSYSRIECTGPKNLFYLKLALENKVTINIDNFEEIEQIISLKNSLGIQEKTKIFIRLAGFSSPRLKFTSQDGTFGIHTNEATRIFNILIQYKEALDFQGFSFHFNAQSPEQKLIAIESTLKLTLDAIKKGLAPRGINIGGGFDICYAENKDEWFTYVETLRKSVASHTESLNWNNSGLGYRSENGNITGAPNFMAHYVERAGAADLDFYLSSPLSGFNDMSFSQVLSDCLLELYIEPGRSLLDQLGITIGRVNFTKKSMHGEQLVGLDMNRHNIHSTHQKLLTDPVILYRNKEHRQDVPNGLYYMGNLCVSYDMVTYSKSFPDFLPEQGDLVTFINTAPYIMDFVESQTLHQNIAEKISIVKKNNTFQWFKDTDYNPQRGRS